MELEGNLILDRKPARRWVSVLAVVIPVLVCLAGVTWFVRAFISPPTISIPGPLVLATTPTPPPPAPPAPAAPRSESPVWPTVTMPPSQGTSSAAFGLPPGTAPISAPQTSSVFPPPATTPAPARAPQTTGGFPPPQSTRTAASAPFADPTRDRATPPASAAVVAAPAIEPPAMAMTDPVPLPRARPSDAMMAAAQVVPLPRPRPTEEEADPAATAPTPGSILNAEPQYGRHTVE